MKQQLHLSFVLLLCLTGHRLFGQSPHPGSTVIQLSATVVESPPQITVSWEQAGIPVCTDSIWLNIFRRQTGHTAWDTLPVVYIADTVFIDNNVVAGVTYEYKVSSTRNIIPDCSPLGGGCTSHCTYATGFINAGIKSPPMHHRGNLILLVDSIFSDSCAAEITQLMEDISGDGWQVRRHDVSRFWKDTAIRSLIRTNYLADTSINAVLLLGHIPVPYSGNIAPDGHPDHHGAWPADIYYGDVYTEGIPDTYWTDSIINNATAARPANHNVPGDGKWDQSIVPTGGKRLQVSRIDFHDMPAFGRTEVQLMRSYLQRNHDYKTDVLNIQKRGLIDGYDNFFRSFTAIGWRNFPPLTGRDQIHEIDLIPSLNDSSFQWAVGSGPGWYNGAGGIGNTVAFANNEVNGIFIMLFGSYFGDWDNQNNFLRAPLCSPVPALTSCWGARYGIGDNDLFLHHMALGAHIGHSFLINHTNDPDYYTHPQILDGRAIYFALLGDLTLRTDYIKPCTALNLALDPFGIKITWSPSPDTNVGGYYVYRSDSRFGKYEQVSSLITSTTHMDVPVGNGTKYYMVRPVKLVSTPSGSYYNLGIGIKDSIFTGREKPGKDLSVDNIMPDEITIRPNPVSGKLYLAIPPELTGAATLDILDQGGKLILTEGRTLQGRNEIALDVQDLPPGIYLVRITCQHQIRTAKFIRSE